MKVTVERVSTFNLRNLLGHDCPPEVLAAHADCLRRSSVIWLGCADGVEACAVGLIPTTLFSSEAYLWMIHTRICEAHPLRFVRWSRKVMDEALDLFPTLIGLCDVCNPSGRAWLQWLGASFIGSRRVGDRSYDSFRIERWQQ